MTPLNQRPHGWRADKGYHADNPSGFHATGHRVLLLEDDVEEVTTGGIIIAAKTAAAEANRQVIATVIEIGHDAWADKSTDFCEPGDRVLIGEYVGKFHTSPLDGKRYRFVNDLDIISTITEASK